MIWCAVLARYPTCNLPANAVASVVPSSVLAILVQNRRWVPVHVAVAAVAFSRCPAPSHCHRLVDCWICLCRRCGPPIPMRVSRLGSRRVFGPGEHSSSRLCCPASSFHRLDEHAPSSLGREPLSSSSSPPGEAPSVAPIARRSRRAPTLAFARAIVVVVVAPPPPRDAHRKGQSPPEHKPPPLQSKPSTDSVESTSQRSSETFLHTVQTGAIAKAEKKDSGRESHGE